MTKAQKHSSLLAAAGLLLLILDGKTALEGANQGIQLCMQTVIPALFPFLLLSVWFTGSLSGFSHPLLVPLGRLFHIPVGMESLLIPAFLGGYPAGAQCIGQAAASGTLSRKTGERLLAYCSNAGPAFLFGMTAALFSRASVPWLCWAIQILSALTAAQFFSPRLEAASLPKSPAPTLAQSMHTALGAMASICGWVILFRLIGAFAQRWLLHTVPAWGQALIIGLLELSNGCCMLGSVESPELRFVLCNAILSFGGICVAMQTASVAPGFSLRYYLLGKCLQCLTAAVLAIAAVFRLWAIFAAWLLLVLVLHLPNQKNSSIPAESGV